MKTKYKTDKTELENKITDVTYLVKKAKHTELENKIPVFSVLATKSALTVVENKIPDVSTLVEKTNSDAKIIELEKKLADHNHKKYITSSESINLATEVFNLKLSQANIIRKTDFNTELSNLKRKISSNKTSIYLLKMNKKNLKHLI